jgi:hypothetical protein
MDYQINFLCFTKEEFLQKLKTDKEFNDEFGNKGIDQISNLINDIKRESYDWNI